MSITSGDTGTAVADFIAAMTAAGMAPVEPIAGKLGKALVRFRCEGEGRANGWAVLHLDGRPAGAFGNYRLGISERWRAGRGDPLPGDQRRELARQYRAAKAARDAEQAEQHAAVAGICRARWEAASSVDPAHPYLVRKGLAGEALRQSGSRLLVPMCDADGGLWNLQAIDADGGKRFAKGARQQGLHLLVGASGDKVVIGEGWATVAAIRRATGLPVVAAFSSANLMATALAIRDRFPACDIIVAADDDAHLVGHPTIKRNLGVDAATAAAQAVGGRVAMPPRKEVL